MKAYYYLFLIIFLALGCATSSKEYVKTVVDRYEAVVFDDGISLEEAKVIAQNQLVKKNVVELYDIETPQVVQGVSSLSNYQDYWFISFKEKKASNIVFIFMTAIDKQSGRVKFADDYAEDRHWILEAALLR